jgi:hypothetical protein
MYLYVYTYIHVHIGVYLETPQASSDLDGLPLKDIEASFDLDGLPLKDIDFGALPNSKNISLSASSVSSGSESSMGD